MTTVIGSRRDPLRVTPPRGYRPGPRLEDVAAGRAALARGHSGADVRRLQSLLNQLGARPPLEVDGLFGPKTEAALQGLQRRAGGAPTGRLDLETLVMLAMRQGWRGGALEGRGPRRGGAPSFGARAPAGSVPARRLGTARELGGGAAAGRDLQVGLSNATEGSAGPSEPADPAPGARGLAQVRALGGDGPADRELADIQARAVASAERELASGVREQGGANRGPRVDEYARRSRMRPGAWCGFFVGFNLSEAARASGGEFEGLNGMHSMQKARAFFEYRSYTDDSTATNQRLDDLRARHLAEGSARRWMTLSGSGGQRHAAARGRPHEVFEPSDLPIRPGDVAVFGHGHLGMVESYDRATGRLTTIEGNAGDRVQRRTYDLDDPADRARFEGFGRPARGDFSVPRGGRGPSAGEPAGGASEGGPAGPEAAANEPGGARSPTRDGVRAPEAPPLARLPPRPVDAPTGSELLARTAGMSRAEREEAVLQEVLRGNVPDRARAVRPVTLTGRGADGRVHTVETFVAPDYLEVGSDEDAVRMPMTPATAQRIADAVGASLPTSRMVDAIHRSADVRLTPQPIPPSAEMMSNAYFARHEALVDAQLEAVGARPGALVAGHKKDLVLSERLATRPDRVAIYGWHRPDGAPIQPLSTLHVASYADYSHGVRLVSDRVRVDGEWRALADVLSDPTLAPILSAEGPMTATRIP